MYTPIIEVSRKNKSSTIELPPCRTMQEAVSARVRYIEENMPNNKSLHISPGNNLKQPHLVPGNL